MWGPLDLDVSHVSASNTRVRTLEHGTGPVSFMLIIQKQGSPCQTIECRFADIDGVRVQDRGLRPQDQQI